jgi:hypothetical protein
MALTAEEYKDHLLRKLNGDAAIADRDKAFWERELQFAETDAIAAVTQDKITEADTLAEFCRAAALALEDVETFI